MLVVLVVGAVADNALLLVSTHISQQAEQRIENEW